ncbi:hypothetical protein [Mycobacterium talmoniae]|uniref:Uncharacterized protein n=1 Tax=Mycobacterium talmoniae TaxID=1858794 RepID=A0A1S1NLQ2_9MYCO|nr:hypothetical protein [Mycobacterium talmoniae]OHV03706.1 hypothetical protein BKN37_13615 [Mycobacterium talmoniae]
MTAYDDFMAERAAQEQRELAAQRKRTILFALESVDTDGFPRVSGYTVDTLIAHGLIEDVPGDNLQRCRLTPEGRIMLHANPAAVDSSDELALFGAVEC